MANLQTVILNAGKSEILQPNVIVSPKYFKLSSDDIPLNGSVNLSTYSFWYQKNIDIYKTVDADTTEFTCILEKNQNTSKTKSICLFFKSTTGTDDIPFLLGSLPNAIPTDTKIVLTIQFKLTGSTTKIDFKFISSNKLEEGLMSLNNLATLGNQITKHNTILNKIYLPNVLNSPSITASTFTI